jgi:uncharacterized protein YkwD
MKISTLSVTVATLLTLSLSDQVFGASTGHKKCVHRPHRVGPHTRSVSGFPTTYSPVNVPTNTPAHAPPNPPHIHSNPPSSPAPNPAPQPEPTAPAPPSGGSGDSNNPTPAELAYLDPQNAIRSLKGAVAFTWNDTLAAYAQQVANTCVFKHSGGPFGENLSAGTHPFSPAAAIALWTNEESQYDPNDPQPSHYTQEVWKGSKEIGCAVTTCATLVDAFDVSASRLALRLVK